MDINEAKEICKKLTEINVAIWRSSSNEASALRNQFREAYKSIIDAGFKITRYRSDGMPMFRPRINRHIEDVTMCSNDTRFKNDCTTRCISLCTGVDYMTIRNEQLFTAKAMHGGYTWRHDRVWEKSLFSRGFAKIMLKKHMSRATFIRLAKSNSMLPKNMIATASSTHIAAIDMNSLKILDTWNSSGGRILSIYVRKDDVQAYLDWLKNIGYNAIAA